MWFGDWWREEAFVCSRWSSDGCIDVVLADRSETVRAEPFDAIALRIGLLFGDDPDD